MCTFAQRPIWPIYHFLSDSSARQEELRALFLRCARCSWAAVSWAQAPRLGCPAIDLLLYEMVFVLMLGKLLLPGPDASHLIACPQLTLR